MELRALRALGDEIGAERGGGAGFVLDHDGLAQALAQRGGEGARDHVGARAREQRHNDADGPCFLRECCAGEQTERQCGKCLRGFRDECRHSRELPKVPDIQAYL